MFTVSTYGFYVNH